MRLTRNLCLIAILLTSMSFEASLPGSKSKSQTDKKPYQTRGNEGVVWGTVSLIGKHPQNRLIDNSADPICTMKNPNPKTEWVMVRNGRLANVFVYVKSGTALEEYRFEPPERPVILDQRACRFVPHVIGVQTNQTLEILNSDPTTHNVHATPKDNPTSNASQPAGAAALVRQFAHPEAMIPIKCNQHPWMKAYVGVLSHPFFAVSDNKGTFRIEGLPPGKYTIAAWHEEFGEKTVDMTVAPGSKQSLRFSFSSRDRRAWH